MILRTGSFTLLGSRSRNEDALLADNTAGIFAVADGIGGGYHGDLASRMAVNAVAQANQEGASLRKAFESAQRQILEFSRTNLGDALMGTTLTAFEVKTDGIQLCHIGDSRCYQLIGKLLRQFTEDHESYEESMKNPVLSDYLGIPDELVPLRLQWEFIPLSGRQMLLLSTDGLHRQLTDQEVALHAEAAGPEPESIARRLCHVASQKEESDNVTVVCVEVDFGS